MALIAWLVTAALALEVVVADRTDGDPAQAWVRALIRELSTAL